MEWNIFLVILSFHNAKTNYVWLLKTNRRLGIYIEKCVD